MKKIIKNFLPVATVSAMLMVSACSTDPVLEGPTSEAPVQTGGAPTAPSLSTVYEQLNGLTGGWSR